MSLPTHSSSPSLAYVMMTGGLIRRWVQVATPTPSDLTLAMPVQLPLDVLLHVLTFAPPPTLASLSVVCYDLHPSATRLLYSEITLASSQRTYELFFRSHASKADGPCSRTRTLRLDALSGQASRDNDAPLDLPYIPSTLFPSLYSLELDSSSRTLSLVLPILITLNPIGVLIRPSGDGLNYAFLPHLAMSGWTNLQTLDVTSTDLHPPQVRPLSRSF